MQGLVLRRRAPGVDDWVGPCSIAWVLAWPLLAAMWKPDPGIFSGMLIGVGLALLAAGAMVGATQWLVIQRGVSGAWRWIVASAVGWGLGVTLLPWCGIYVASEAGGHAGLLGGLLLIAGGAVAGHAITGAALARGLREPPSRPVNRRRMVLLVDVLWLPLVVAALVILLR